MSQNMPPRVLIAEDDRSWQAILAEILLDAGFPVDIVSDLDAAVAALRATAYRLAIVDLALGDGEVGNQDGLRILDAVRRYAPGCVTLMLTGFATVELAVSVLTEYGAFSCLRKEAFGRQEFLVLVERALSTLPQRLGETDAVPLSVADPRVSHPATPTSLSVLVVEDDAGWRSILSELLLDAGYRVRLCNGFGEALGCLRRERFTLAVIDLCLATVARNSVEDVPPREGYQLLAKAREQSVPTLVVSGLADACDIERAYDEYGVAAYLEKRTFDRRAFLQAVSEALRASTGRPDLSCLTERERGVLALLAQGRTNKEIASALVITPNTVKRHLKAIFEKLRVHTRSAAAALAIGAGLSLPESDTVSPIE